MALINDKRKARTGSMYEFVYRILKLELHNSGNYILDVI